MQENLEDIIKSVFDQYTKEDYIHASDLPDIDLYVDQVTTYLSSRLSKTMRHPDDKLMTKTMINNYAKNHLLPPPEKKKYSKDHILVMIFIYYFKNFLSINDIQRLMTPMTEKYFHSNGDLSLSTVYERLFSKEPELIEHIAEDIRTTYKRAAEIFQDAPEKDQDYLELFSFISMMSVDIYMRKQMIEQCIDRLLVDQEPGQGKSR